MNSRPDIMSCSFARIKPFTCVAHSHQLKGLCDTKYDNYDKL